MMEGKGCQAEYMAGPVFNLSGSSTIVSRR